MNNHDLIAASEAAFIGTYKRFPVAMVAGDGCWLTDADGKRYLDFLSGIAVCSLGHCHPAVTKAICEQAARLVHVSNLFHTEPQTRLATMLVENSFADRVFFGNSGAEANEAAIKLARIASPAERYEIISLEGSFHGRTLATVAATGQVKFHAGFEPLPQGFKAAPFGDLAAMEEMIGPHTCAILCEPLQGESGVRPLGREYLQGIRALCDRHNLLLIYDEVQVGMGRTGSLFAYEQLGVVPDIMTLAKALGNGLPLGAMLTSNEIAAAFTPGTHASTFGGNPVACAAGVAVMETMLQDDFMPQVRDRGAYLARGLERLAQKYPDLATGARGAGLIQAMVLSEAGIRQGAAIVNALFAQGVLANFAGNAVLRFIPPLIVSEDEIDQMLAVLDRVLLEL
jgi:acetylornithine aminotransferase/acetylornithine/N-succinyldiaminopimelate aminotransferase